MFTGASMLLTVNEHNMQLQRALDECRREYNVLIHSYEFPKGDTTTAYHNARPNTKTIEGKPS
jgi:hypothetical protein